MASRIFKSPNEFCLYLEKVKKDNEIDTYTETLTWFYENESDLEFENIVRMLNSKIINAVEYEARKNNMLKDKSVINELF